MKIFKKDWVAITIFFSISLVVVYSYYYRIFVPNFNQILSLHNEILQGTAGTPYRYRIFVPFITEILSKAFQYITSMDIAYTLSYLIYFTIAIFFIFLILFYYLNNFFSKTLSLVGVLFVSGTIDIALRDHYYQPWTLLEVVFFTLGLYLIYKEKNVLVALTIIIATLNRETAVLIPMAYIFIKIDIINIFRQKKEVFLSVIYSLLWFVVFIGLRYYLGEGGRTIAVQQIWDINMNNIQKVAVNNLLFMGIFWLFMLKGFKNANIFIKKTTLVIPFYLILILIYGYWHEVRLLMPLYPIIIPLGITYLNTKFIDDYV